MTLQTKKRIEQHLTIKDIRGYVTQSQESKKINFSSLLLLELYAFGRFLCDLKSRYLQYFLTKQAWANVFVIHAFKNSYGGGIAHCFRKSFVLEWFVLDIIKNFMFWFFLKKLNFLCIPIYPSNPKAVPRVIRLHTSVCKMQNVLVLLSTRWKYCQNTFLASEMP